MDALGAVSQRLSFDPWGKRTDGVVSPLTTRQFTGHEAIPAVGLINMNARIYDPELGRMMSADPTVPDPFASQSFNRFSYVNNNPLSFTDPSGLVPLPGASIGYCYGNCPGAYFNYLFYGCFYCVPFPPIPYAGSLGGVAGGDYAPAPHQTDKKTSQDRSWVNTPASLSAAGYSYTPSPSGMTGISGGGAVPAVFGDPCAHNPSGCIVVTGHRDTPDGARVYLANSACTSAAAAAAGMCTVTVIAGAACPETGASCPVAVGAAEACVNAVGAAAAICAASSSDDSNSGKPKTTPTTQNQADTAGTPPDPDDEGWMSDKQLGKKFGEHMDPSRPGYRTPQEYRELATQIRNDPNATRTIRPNGEIWIRSGGNVLRLDPEGNFITLYPE